MFVSEVVVEKKSLKLVQNKINLNMLFLGLFIFGIILSAGIIVFGIVKNITDFNTYLFGAFGILIPAFWLFIVLKDYKNLKQMKSEIITKGNYNYKNPLEINPQRKFNGSTVTSIICAIFVLICLVAVIVVQCVNYNINTLYTIPISFVLFACLTYQAIMGILNDKIYRNSIID